MKKSSILLRIYDKLKAGKYLEINECCGEFGISVPTFRRYLSFLRDYFCENFSQEIIYDAENKKYILK